LVAVLQFLLLARLSRLHLGGTGILHLDAVTVSENKYALPGSGFADRA
jgi:hypothetical protein